MDETGEIRELAGYIGPFVRLTLPRVIARKAVLVPLLVAVVAGCSGGDPEVVVPPPLPEITARPTPSASATPAALPSAAHQPTPQGAAAFVRAYYDEVSRVLVTQDTTRLRDLSAPSCQACSAIIAGVHREKAVGNNYRGGGVTEFEAQAVQEPGNRMAVSVRYSSRRLQRTSATGEVDQVPGANGTLLEVLLQRTPSGWLVAEIARANA